MQTKRWVLLGLCLLIMAASVNAVTLRQGTVDFTEDDSGFVTERTLSKLILNIRPDGGNVYLSVRGQTQDGEKVRMVMKGNIMDSYGTEDGSSVFVASGMTRLLVTNNGRYIVTTNLDGSTNKVRTNVHSPIKLLRQENIIVTHTVDDQWSVQGSDFIITNLREDS